MNFKLKTFFLTGPMLFLLRSFFPLAISAQSSAPPANIKDMNTVFFSVISSIISLVALASLAMLVLGGYRYLSAGADKNSATLAQQTITHSLAGLIITLSSWIILNLMGSFLGISIRPFDICVVAGC